jgi:hypothetical protein
MTVTLLAPARAFALPLDPLEALRSTKSVARPADHPR